MATTPKLQPERGHPKTRVPSDSPSSNHGFALWMATGSALVGTLLGALAVWLALRGPELSTWPIPAQTATTLLPSVSGVPRSSAQVETVAAPLGHASLADVVERTRGSVVSIKLGNDLLGAGVIVSPDGGVLTNHHVIEPALRGVNEAEPPVTVRFADGRELKARIGIWDSDQDIAIVRIMDGFEDERFDAVAAGSSDQLRVGDSIFVVGCPLGLEHTVSLGIVSALDRTERLPNPLLPAIQLDASINLGNSGGPLFNMRGELVGITTTRARNAQGIGFAIPVDRIRAFLENPNSGDASSEIGIEVRAGAVTGPSLKSLGYLQGVEVVKVFDGPARSAGMRPGDIIVELRGRRFDLPAAHGQLHGPPDVLVQFKRVVAWLIPGETLKLTVIRGDKLVGLQVRARGMGPLRRGLRLSERVLGLQLEGYDGKAGQDDNPGPLRPTIHKILKGSALDRRLLPSNRHPGTRASYRERLNGATIVEIGVYPIESVESLGSVLAHIRTMIAAGASPRVRVTFEDADKRRFVFGSYPLEAS